MLCFTHFWNTTGNLGKWPEQNCWMFEFIFKHYHTLYGRPTFIWFFIPNHTLKTAEMVDVNQVCYSHCFSTATITNEYWILQWSAMFSNYHNLRVYAFGNSLEDYMVPIITGLTHFSDVLVDVSVLMIIQKVFQFLFSYLEQ